MSRITLTCGCRVTQSSAYSHKTAVVGGKRFTSRERLIKGKRCGSVVTRVVGGRSVYGLVKEFVRIICNCMICSDFGLITWFPDPVYPDGDPLTVRINLGGIDVNNIARVHVASLNCIAPARVCVSIDSWNDCMFMMRLDGTDTIP